MDDPDDDGPLARAKPPPETIHAPVPPMVRSPAAPAPATTLAPGAIIANYEVDRKIGEGGFGEVWRIRHREFGTRRALKVLPGAVESVIRERFKQEMQLLAQISHNNVVQVIDSGELPDGSPYYIMAWLRGNDLEREVRTKYHGRPPPWSVTREVVLQILSGLEAIHRKHIVHRDLKPQNCMEDPDPSGDDFQTCWKIVDLGIAKRLAAGHAGLSLVHGAVPRRGGTGTGNFLGTLDYAAPEQLAGDSTRISYPTDIYSVGVILYELLTGQVPHPATREEDSEDGLELRLRRIAAEPPPPPSRVAPGTFPSEIDDVVLRALRHDPRERFQSAGEFAEALRQSESGLFAPPKPPPRDRSAAAPATPALRPLAAGRPGVVVVELPPSRLRRRLVAPLALFAGVVVTFAVMHIGDRLRAPTPAAEPSAIASPPASEPVLEQARAAIRGLGLKETNKAQAALQKLVDDERLPPASAAEARALLAELLLTRALACRIAVILEPSAMGGEALARSTEDLPAARELTTAVPAGPTRDHLQLLDALASEPLTRDAGPAAPRDGPLLARAARLWRDHPIPAAARPRPPAELLAELRRRDDPTTLERSLLALALAHAGDELGARDLLLAILGDVPDQPVARTLLDLLDRQGMLTAAGDPEVAVRPAAAPAVDADRPPRRPRPESDILEPTRVETMISDGCQKVRAGDPDGVQHLLAAIEQGARADSNFNLCFCLGTGFARQNAHESAFTWYSRAAEQSPTNRDALAGAARSAELLGRAAAAVGLYKRLQALDPGNTAAATFLARHEEGLPDELMLVPRTKR